MEYKFIQGTLTEDFKSGCNSLYEFSEYVTVKNVFGEVVDSFKYVVISDASTHVERMVFAARLIGGMTAEDVRNGVPETLEIDYSGVGGVMTMMIHGGDYSTIEPPESYLEQLIENNIYE